MLFSSLPFLFYFLPAVLMVYFLVPRQLKNGVLLLSSLIFYGWGEPKYVLLMIATIALFYGCGLAIEGAKQPRWKKVWLLVSVVLSLSLLGLFKYADFFLSSFNAVTGLSEGLNCAVERIDDTGGAQDLLLLDLPVVLSLLPVTHSSLVLRGGIGISKRILVHISLQSFQNLRDLDKLHIGDREGNDVVLLGDAVLLHLVPFLGTYMTPGLYSFKIILHDAVSLS